MNFSLKDHVPVMVSFPRNPPPTMIRFLLLPLLLSVLHAGVRIDQDALGESLGGWTVKKKSAADYDLSGAEYRTYKPEISPTPEGGIFVSLRIDHRRGWLASDDHAVLEITIDRDGAIVSAQSSLALQGRTVSSDLIRAGGDVGKGVPGVGAAVKVGADLTADLSAKLLREKIVEPGRVNFPAAIRHNYNLLFQAIRTTPEHVPAPLDPSKLERKVEPKPAPKLDVKGVGQATEVKK